MSAEAQARSVSEFALFRRQAHIQAGRFLIAAAKEIEPAGLRRSDVRFAPDGHLLYVADVFRDLVVVMNPQSGVILSKIKTGRRPFRILFHPSGKTMYVSSWADGSIGQYDVNSGERADEYPGCAASRWIWFGWMVDCRQARWRTTAVKRRRSRPGCSCQQRLYEQRLRARGDWDR